METRASERQEILAAREKKAKQLTKDVKVKMKKWMTALILLNPLFISPSVWACSCAGPRPIDMSFEEAKAIFTAHVDILKKNKNGHTVEVILKVGNVWKGAPGERMTVGLPRGGCAYWNFKENTSYLIYAHAAWDKNDPDGLDISMCSRTKPLNEGRIETMYLDAIIAGEDITGMDESLPRFLLEDKSPYLRAEAARKLGWMFRVWKDRAPTNTVDALIEATRDSNNQVKVEAANSLANLYLKGTPGLKEALLNMLHDEDSEVRRAASNALSMIGIREPDVFSALKNSFEDALASKEELPSKEYERMVVNFGVSMTKLAAGDEEKMEAVDLILPVLDEINDPYWKVSVIQHLGFLKKHALKTVPALIDMLQASDHYHLKQYTIHALGDIGDPEALDVIKPYINDENCYVVQSAVIAVHKIDPQGFGVFFNAQAMPVMQKRFDECQHQFIWGLQTIGAPAKDMAPFLTEKFEGMEEGNWIKDTLKNVLDSWSD